MMLWEDVQDTLPQGLERLTSNECYHSPLCLLIALYLVRNESFQGIWENSSKLCCSVRK